MLVNIVRADTNVNIDVGTDTADIYANANAHSNYGNVYWNLNGIPIEDAMRNSGSSIEYFYWKFSEIFMKGDYKNVYSEVNPNDLNSISAKRFRWTMDTYFVPRTEFNQLIDYTNSLDARITTLEEIVGLDKVLEKNKEFARENNLKEFIFKGKKYIKVGNDYVHIELKTVTQEKEINTSKEVEEGIIDLHQNMIDNWRRMCNNGMIQFCKILEQRGIESE